MQFELPENISDLAVYDVNGEKLSFDNKDDLDEKLKNCNIQPIIGFKGIEFTEDGEMKPSMVLESIKIVSYVDSN